MFFTPRWLIERLASAKDAGYAHAIDAIKKGHEVAISAKEQECKILRSEIANLNVMLEIERHRANAAIDRLLVKEAKVYPLGNPNPETKVKEDQVRKKLDEIFSEVNQVGEDVGHEYIGDKVVLAGGGVLPRANAPR